jgi:hypothetical protein
MWGEIKGKVAHQNTRSSSLQHPGENLSLKLTTQDLPEHYSEKLNFHQLAYMCR